MIPLAEQLACVRRELSMRRKFYPQWVATGKKPAAQADEELAAMAAVVATLEKLTTINEVGEEMVREWREGQAK